MTMKNIYNKMKSLFKFHNILFNRIFLKTYLMKNIYKDYNILLIVITATTIMSIQNEMTVKC